MLFQPKRNTFLGIGSLLGATFLYGFFGIFVKTIGYSLPLFYASVFRDLISVSILAIPVYFLRAKVLKKIKMSDMVWMFLRSLFGMIAFLGSYTSFEKLSIGTAYLFFYSAATIGGYFFGIVLFKEKLTSIKILSLVLALAGLVFIYSLNMAPGNLLYMLAAVISGISYSIWSVFSKKVSDNYNPLQLNFVDFFFSFTFMTIISLLLRENWVMPEANVIWGANILLALMYIFTGQLIIIGYNNLEAQVASLVMLMEILFGVLLGFIVFREVLSLPMIFGGLLIITAIILPELNFKKSFFLL